MGWVLPIAPASKSASAWTSPRPRAAPLTRTTLPTRLNSGNRFAVPTYPGAFEESLAKAREDDGDFGGGEGMSLAVNKGLNAENDRVMAREGWVVITRLRKRCWRRAEFMMSVCNCFLPENGVK